MERSAVLLILQFCFPFLLSDPLAADVQPRQHAVHQSWDPALAAKSGSRISRLQMTFTRASSAARQGWQGKALCFVMCSLLGAKASDGKSLLKIPTVNVTRIPQGTIEIRRCSEYTTLGQILLYSPSSHRLQ